MDYAYVRCGIARRVEASARVKSLNRPSPLGRELGAELVRLYEPEIARLAAAGVPDERCASCALRLGTWPNGCETSLMDAIKCAFEGVPFLCHENGRMVDGVRPECHGWRAMVPKDGGVREMPWSWSYEETEAADDAR